MFEKITLFLATLLICSIQDVESVRLVLDHFEPHCDKCVTANDAYNVSGRLILEGAELVHSVPTFVLFDIFCRRGLGRYQPSIMKDVWISICYTHFKICSSKSDEYKKYPEQTCACRKLHEKVYKIWITQAEPYLYRLCSFRARMTYDKGFKRFYPQNDTGHVTMSKAVNVADLFKTSLYNDTLNQFYDEKNKEDLLNVLALKRYDKNAQRCFSADLFLVFTGVCLALETVRVNRNNHPRGNPFLNWPSPLRVMHV